MKSESSDISLLPEDIQQSRAVEGRHKKIKKVSIAVLGVVALVSAISVGVSAHYSNQSLELEEKLSQAERNVTSLQEIEDLVKSFSNRTQAISRIFSRRVYYSHLVTALRQVVPDYVVLSDIVISEDQVKVSGSALDYIALAEFINNTTLANKGGAVFSKTELTGISLDKRSGTVRFSATLLLI